MNNNKNDVTNILEILEAIRLDLWSLKQIIENKLLELDNLTDEIKELFNIKEIYKSETI